MIEKSRIFVWYYLPPLLMMVLIFGGSSQSEFPDWLPDWMEKIHIDKIIHTAEYMVLAWLWIRALTLGRPRNARLQDLGWAVGITFVYGLTDEFHQIFVPNRTPDIWDALADLTGAMISAVWVFLRRTPHNLVKT